MGKMKVFLGSDHAGYMVKEKVKHHLDSLRIDYEDLGPYMMNTEDDYPDYAFKVAHAVARNPKSRGILVCGSGSGMTIAANKVKNIRAVAAYDAYSAKMSRQDNDTNILGLRGRNFPFVLIKKIVDIWLHTPFSKQARHSRRLKKIQSYER